MPQNYLVLGASGGIGSATSRRLRSRGANVMLAGRNAGQLSALGQELSSPCCVVDATSFAEVDACFDQALEAFGELHGVVNCVGSVLLKPAHLTDEGEWRSTLDANLTSAFAVVRSAARTMKQSGGSVVLMSSAAARVGLANHEAIAAAKAGVIGLALSAAATYAPRGIRVNAIAPGLIQTELTRRIWSNERTAQVSRSMHPLGRLGEAKDVASLVVWLLDPENDWVTGQLFGVDGGLGSIK